MKKKWRANWFTEFLFEWLPDPSADNFFIFGLFLFVAVICVCGFMRAIHIQQEIRACEIQKNKRCLRYFVR